jgi:hypothetical protein
MWPGKSGGPGLFKDAAWRERGDDGRNGDSNVRYAVFMGLTSSTHRV